MKDVALLILRLTVGALMAGHGAQKLFGWFGGYGLKGTAGWLESMGMRPGKPWAMLAAGSEFGGGLLTLLGFLNPLGPLGIIGSMGMAAAKVHGGKPIWVTSGGAELPVTNIAAAAAVALAGPGAISLDRALGIKLPRRLVFVPGLVVAAIGVAVGLMISNQPQEEEAVEEAAQPQAGRELPARVPAEAAGREGAATEQLPEEIPGAALQAGQEAAHEV